MMSSLKYVQHRTYSRVMGINYIGNERYGRTNDRVRLTGSLKIGCKVIVDKNWETTERLC